jgi:hypothetical protein
LHGIISRKQALIRVGTIAEFLEEVGPEAENDLVLRRLLGVSLIGRCASVRADTWCTKALAAAH